MNRSTNCVLLWIASALLRDAVTKDDIKSSIAQECDADHIDTKIRYSAKAPDQSFA
jgi:hypothetical protein